ncbi:MAG: prolipoprotein diacylglyceryl transferase, partial [Clostridia bacterium]
VLTVIVGYGSAVLFQAFYNYERTGIFEITSSTGATFYGGLIGGAVFFILFYFIVGQIVFKDKQHLHNFDKIASSAACAIPLAHGLGRIGCLMAGCCYGLRSDTIWGIYMVNLGYKVLPTQLYEAIFLFGLFVFLALRYVKYKRNGNLGVYLIVYGVWRFAIEYIRADERGNTFISFLSPSQLTAIVMVLSGIAWLVVISRLDKRNKKVEA